MKRTPLKRKTPLKQRTPLKATGKKQPKRKPLEKYKAPKWFNRIAYGSHGSTPAQKRVWKALSDRYRQEDYEVFQGHCPICSKHIERWQDLQLGHFHRWSVCNSWFKYERRNLLGICAGCNIHDGGITSFKFAERLKERYGEDIILWIEIENEKYRGLKMETWALVDYLSRISPELVSKE